MPIDKLLPLYRGMFHNIKDNITLPFMLNPQPISKNKNVTWDIEEIPGLDSPIYTFQSGGQKTISFQLFWDSIGSEYIPNFNNYKDIFSNDLMLVEAILESFLYPGRAKYNNKDRMSDILLPPPMIGLIMGLRYWYGYLLSAPVEETKFSRSLLPTQITSQIEFGVVETGEFQENDVDFQWRKKLDKTDVYQGTSAYSTGQGDRDTSFSYSIPLS
jgi:hypothetical protein